MKFITTNIKNPWVSRFLMATAVVFLMAFSAVAQTESDSTEAEKPDLSLEFRYIEANNKTKILELIAKAKLEGIWQSQKGIQVHFYRDAEDEANLLGNVATDDHGLARYILPEGVEKYAGAGGEYTFVAVTDGTEQFDPVSVEVIVAESSFEMSLSEEDSVRQVHISLQALDAEGNEVPVGEVEVHLYIQRLFGLLPLSEDPETTDENGEVTADFSTVIGGDTAGNLIIVAKIEDHERFGNVEFQRKIKWGTPLIIDPNLSARELWSSRANAPIYLIAIVNTMLIGIWGVILYILFQTYKISKISKVSTRSPKLEKHH
ncbi:MAG: hypothetical protein Q7T20_11835 [Saprospiraceae bacterium]|nr:hypothetical protein [Saprospiraceae bacterium]